MRVRMTTLIAIFASTAVLAGADNSLGTWKLNVGKSQYIPPPLPYKSLTMVRTAVDSGVKTTVTAQRLNGTRMSLSYSAKYDGASCPIYGTGNPNDTISWRQMGANTFISERHKPGGKYHVIGRFVISEDRKTMTATISGTDADGKPAKATIVYERQ
jgi:hypothetical protein